VDVFALRDRLVADYEEFTRSFIQGKDHIRDVVDRELAEGLLWPESLIQLNPSFQPGATIDNLVDEGVLPEDGRRLTLLDAPLAWAWALDHLANGHTSCTAEVAPTPTVAAPLEREVLGVVSPAPSVDAPETGTVGRAMEGA
jgi:hypothetical protein